MATTLSLAEAFTLGAAGVSAVLLLTLPAVLRERARRVGFARRREHAARGEDRAQHLLTDAGFELVGRRVAGGYPVLVDDVPVMIALQADYVVERSGRRYVAEVKTGRLAPRVEEAATRRQLLEYRIAFAVDGVLLVDADSGAIRSVEFPLEATKARPRGLGWLLLLVLALALAAWAILAKDARGWW